MRLCLVTCRWTYTSFLMNLRQTVRAGVILRRLRLLIAWLTSSISTCVYGLVLQTEAEEAVINKPRSAQAMKKITDRQQTAKVEHAVEDQFHQGRLLGECTACLWYFEQSSLSETLAYSLMHASVRLLFQVVKKSPKLDRNHYCINPSVTHRRMI